MNTSDTAYVIAHDLGTTGNKATLVDATGTIVGSVTVKYPVDWGDNGKAEQNPEDWWDAFCKANHQLISQSEVRGEQIQAISFSGQMMGAVFVDSDAHAVRPATIWADTRSQKQCDQILERIGMERVYRITGHRANPTYSLTKMMWVRDNDPEAFSSAVRVLNAKDYIVARLTGEFVSDPSDASGTNLYDQESGTWSDEILAASGLSANLLPQLKPSTEVIGTIRPELVEQTGLPATVQVVLGGGDGPMGALGSGIIDRSSGIYSYLGSSSWVSFADDKPLLDPQMRSMTFNHVLPDAFVPTATMQAGGGSLDWAVSSFLPDSDQRFETLLGEAETAQASADGLYFLPHLLGERAPYWNPKARGVYAGLTMSHDRSNMIRAVIEGVAFNLKTGLVAFAESGHTFDSIDIIGGASKSPVVQRILADIWQMSVVPSSIGDHATSLGAAAVAAAGSGLIDIADIADFVRADFDAPTGPNLSAEQAQLRYETFMDAYERIEPWFERLS